MLEFFKKLFRSDVEEVETPSELEPVLECRPFGDTTHTQMVVSFGNYSYLACRWFKNGDHMHDSVASSSLEGLLVRYYRNPEYPGDAICPVCGYTYNEHGFIDKERDALNTFNSNMVCPGDWVLHTEELDFNDPGSTAILTDEVFKTLYQINDTTWDLEVCKECGNRNTVGFDVPDSIWQEVVGDTESVHCLSCFDKKAQEKGVHYQKHLQLYIVTWADANSIED